MTTIVISDFQKHRRWTMVLDGDDFEFVAAVWKNQDRILLELQDKALFAGLTRWCELSPLHYRLMITANLNKVQSLSDAELTNRGNSIVQSLYYLICATIYCLQERAQTTVELLKITRYSEYIVNFDLMASLTLAIGRHEADTDQDGFKIVIDNT